MTSRRRCLADRGGRKKFARYESGVGHTTTSLHARIRHRRSAEMILCPLPFGEGLSGQNTECRTPRAWVAPRLAGPIQSDHLKLLQSVGFKEPDDVSIQAAIKANDGVRGGVVIE